MYQTKTTQISRGKGAGGKANAYLKYTILLPGCVHLDVLGNTVPLALLELERAAVPRAILHTRERAALAGHRVRTLLAEVVLLILEVDVHVCLALSILAPHKTGSEAIFTVGHRRVAAALQVAAMETRELATHDKVEVLGEVHLVLEHRALVEI